MSKFTLLDLLIYGLACFRLAVLLSEDSGPMRAFARLRAWLKREEKKNPVLRKSDVAHGVDCLRCTSVWVAIPVAAYALFRPRLNDWITTAGDLFVFAMAFSALAILANRMFPKR